MRLVALIRKAIGELGHAYAETSGLRIDVRPLER
jgi:hypothetical protein